MTVHEAALGKLPQTAAQYCNPERPSTFIVGPGNHRRWEIMLSPGEDPREMEKAENVWRLLSPWLEAGDGALWHASSYRFHALLAAEWRKGRFFLAGDAAHQQPPFIGQGMCQGIRDVTNLCWKLIEVINGRAGDTLLYTYEEERRRHVHTLTSRIKAIGYHICERDPAAARQRDAALLLQGGGQAPTVTRQEIVPPLGTGLIANHAHPANGTLFPQPWILSPAGAEHMDVLTGHGWRLVLDGRQNIEKDVDVPHDLALKIVVIGGAGFEEQDGVAAKWFQQNASVGAIVRPDHYVYATASTVAQIGPLLSGLCLALNSPGSGAC